MGRGRFPETMGDSEVRAGETSRIRYCKPSGHQGNYLKKMSYFRAISGPSGHRELASSIMLDILSFLTRAHIDSFRAHYILAVSGVKMRVFQGQHEFPALGCSIHSRAWGRSGIL